MSDAISRRVRTYPRVVALVIWTAIVINWIGASGWRGWGGQLLAPDFLVFYGAGSLFRTAPQSLYDFNAQLTLQRAIVAPTALTGTGPFSHPPYVAPLLELFSLLPYSISLFIWTALSCAALAASIALTQRVLAQASIRPEVTNATLAAVALSSAPIVLGLYSGQMHTFALLASLAVILLTSQGKLWAAGMVTGVLAIKPQLALAFGLLFVARGAWRACLGAGLTFAILNAVVVFQTGWATGLTLYADFVSTAGALMQIHYNPGFPSYLMMTPYGFLAGATGIEHQQLSAVLCNGLAIVLMAWFLYDAWRRRSAGVDGMRRVYARTLLLPFLATPYWMLYDGASLFIVCALLATTDRTAASLRFASAVYGWLWVFGPVSAIIGVPLGVAAPAALWVSSARRDRSPTSAARSEELKERSLLGAVGDGSIRLDR